MTPESWIGSADRALAFAATRIQLIRAVTPTDADAEIADLTRSYRRGAPRAPRFVYDGVVVPVELCLALEKLSAFLEGLSPLGQVYAARARELCLEAAIIDSVGTPMLRARAEERFLPVSEEARADLARADELALSWLRGPTDVLVPFADDERVKTGDESNAESLVSRMSAEVGRRRLPFRVVLQAGLASLAATGDGVILVAPDKRIGRRDVERTVLHEIAGHALPRAEAIRQSLGIFAVGTARGIDDQEGRALLIEESAGFLDASRRRELALRHIAARAALEGRSFLDVVESLLARGADVDDAIRIAVRVGRGGAGSGGLGREVVYLPAFLRVQRALCGNFAALVERTMASGRIAVDVAPVVANATGMGDVRLDSEKVAIPAHRD